MRKELVEEVVAGEWTNTIPDFGDGRTWILIQWQRNWRKRLPSTQIVSENLFEEKVKKIMDSEKSGNIFLWHGNVLYEQPENVYKLKST